MKIIQSDLAIYFEFLIQYEGLKTHNSISPYDLVEANDQLPQHEWEQQEYDDNFNWDPNDSKDANASTKPSFQYILDRERIILAHLNMNDVSFEVTKTTIANVRNKLEKALEIDVGEGKKISSVNLNNLSGIQWSVAEQKAKPTREWIPIKMTATNGDIITFDTVDKADDYLSKLYVAHEAIHTKYNTIIARIIKNRAVLLDTSKSLKKRKEAAKELWEWLNNAEKKSEKLLLTK